MRITVLGLSLSSSWGNGHATTWRGLLRALAERGHELAFLERDVPWYARHRDLPQPDFCRLELYGGLEELRERLAEEVRGADAVLVGSYVPEGLRVAEWVLDTACGVSAFYDIDTPVTLAKLSRRDHEYLSPELASRFDLYLSFAGGRSLVQLAALGVRRPRALYCAVDPRVHRRNGESVALDLGYLGTYSPDRQPALERLLLASARRWSDGRFAVAGAQYPPEVAWPDNVAHHEHLPPDAHASFYSAQRFALNVSRADMAQLGSAPSVRLFEAAACGTPVISDVWEGVERFFVPGREIFLAEDADDVLHLLRDCPEERRGRVAAAARRRVLAEHSAERRAEQLEGYLAEARDAAPRPRAGVAREARLAG